MKASALEFRLRFWIMVAIYLLGFTAPWDAALHLDGSGPNAHLWGLLAALLAKTGAVSIRSAFNLVLCLGILCALAGTSLRTWATACLGADVMQDARMHGVGVVASGPYRHLRNPLYLGDCLNALALALLMPASGAVFTCVLAVLFLMRLLLAEESFLTAKLGAPYLAYCARVPRLLPSLRPRIATSKARPHWPQAILAEIFMWGVIASFAVLGWQYNEFLLTKCMLVSLGVSLVVRAFQMQNRPAA